MSLVSLFLPISLLVIRLVEFCNIELWVVLVLVVSMVVVIFAIVVVAMFRMSMLTTWVVGARAERLLGAWWTGCKCWIGRDTARVELAWLMVVVEVTREGMGRG